MILKHESFSTNQHNWRPQNLKTRRKNQQWNSSHHYLHHPAPSQSQKVFHLSHWNINPAPQSPGIKNKQFQKKHGLRTHVLLLRSHKYSLTPHGLHTHSPHLLLQHPGPSPCWQPSLTVSPGTHNLDTNQSRWVLIYHKNWRLFTNILSWFFACVLSYTPFGMFTL